MPCDWSIPRATAISAPCARSSTGTNLRFTKPQGANMLSSLHLRDFVIVAETSIQLTGGFTVFTGETGAGKSLLIDALGLLSGERADPKMVRPGSKRAELAARFEIDPQHPVHQDLRDADMEGDDGELLLRRTLDADGRSKAYINGHPATMQQLRELTGQLITTHGQHASIALTSSESARAWLDRYGSHHDLLLAYGKSFDHYSQLRERFDQATSMQAQGQTRLEQLQWMLDSLQEIQPKANEWAQIQAEHHRLSHGEKLLEAIHSTLDQCVDGDDPILSRLHRMISKLAQLLDVDPALKASLELIDNARIQLEEASQQLRDDLERAEADPARYAEIEARMSILYQTARKLRIAPEELAERQQAYLEEQRALEQLSDLAEIEKQLSKAFDALQTLGLSLRAKRKQTADSFSASVNALLPALGLPKARLSLDFEAIEAQAHGIDRVNFLWQAHAGAQARLLAKTASGGELSRIALAISTASAQSNPTPTLIFDEADAGVGGAVGQAIGELMRDLGQTRQVLCVTHLPQVASQAHQQFKVLKREQDGLTYSDVQTLDTEDRTEEIARMLGGKEITTTTRLAAREMLKLKG
ncbi:MAG: DNA repair protein RecN [Betaproteobacteria bacterium]|nr:DNA repair protein RecN [Betaproteobacteria bacterium]NBY54467.1 DNA repair protein RecN [Betaproteobacteria bacterium]NCY06039.1 DNA repair protein RecN [Betaproteobacteria bacterium]NDG80299.1 DNA repair protein RecN [Betaproteobacteria bacterium]